MKVLWEYLLLLVNNENYSKIATLLIIILVIYGFYQKIKFSCLYKASEMVAKVESNKELTGKEKFATVVLWINEELPKVFKSSVFQNILQKLIEYAYSTSKDYMEEYVKRTTGESISTIIQKSKEEDNKSSTDNK